MRESYRHTQVGTVILVPLAIPAVAMLSAVLAGAPRMPLFALAGLFVLLSFLFGSMTGAVDGAAVSIRFGIGLIGRNFALADIRAVRAVRNEWYHGWGIRLLPRAWLYNVSGLDAVELEMANGKVHRVGTDEPGALAAAIERARGVAA
jgi:hypothetical protein